MNHGVIRAGEFKTYRHEDDEHARNKIATPENIGFLVLNQHGASRLYDTGGDAAYMADYYNASVIVADRPGTGWILPNMDVRYRNTHDYVSQMKIVAKHIAKTADEEGLDHLIVVGRSAGGQGAMALTRTEILPVNGLFVAEPVGWRRFADTKEAKAKWVMYNELQKKLLTDNEQILIHPDKTEAAGLKYLRRLCAIGYMALVDQYHNQDLWSIGITRTYARDIATKQPDIDTQIAFAAHTSFITPEQLAKDSTVLPAMRSSQENGAPYEVHSAPRTVHSSFDLRGYVNQIIEPLVKRVVERTVKP